MAALSRALPPLSASSSKQPLLRLLLPSSSSFYSTKSKRKKWIPDAPAEPQAPPPPVEASWLSAPVEQPAAASLTRPPVMPWTEELANSVRLVGSVKMPVQLEKTAEGRPWAVSLLMQEKSKASPQFWTPVMFEDDLAEIAACHLKMNDLIYVSGQLMGDPPTPDMDYSQANFQVMVQNFSFVQLVDSVKESNVVSEKSEQEYKLTASEGTTIGSEVESCWTGLISSPNQWWDYREAKLNRLVSSNFPDFKHKTSGRPVWIDRAPKHVLEQLHRLKFDAKTIIQDEKKSQTEERWMKLLENPDEYWDNRLAKPNQKHPDFKHKVTGEGLWIDSSPSWVLPKLALLKKQQSVDPK